MAAMLVHPGDAPNGDDEWRAVLTVVADYVHLPGAVNTDASDDPALPR